MKTLQDVIAEAQTNGTAVGHFNVATLEMFNAVIGAAQETELPVIIGVSEGEREFIGIHTIVALIRQAQANGVTVFLNADHTYSVDGVKKALDAGFDSVIIDGAKLPFDENVAQTRTVVEYARDHAPEALVEAEFGYIGTSSKILEEVPEGVDEDTLTKPEEARKFVEETGVDLLAPSVGNMHGMFKGGDNPGDLHIDLIKEIVEATGVPLVLHGGSGTSDDDFIAAAEAGTAIIHVSTEMRVAYKSGLEMTMQQKPDELAPYRLLKQSKENVQKVVQKRMELFAGK